MIDYAEFKKFFIWNMIGSLIICALVAVVAVLVNSFGEVAQKALFTLSMIVIHSLVALLFIWDDEKQGTFNRLSFFINVIFFLIVLSFLTSIFGIWNIGGLAGSVGDLYQFYFIIAFAALHGNILFRAAGKENYIDTTIVLNYVFMILVVLMLAPIIFLSSPFTYLPEFYFRLLGAVAIIDGTLSILTIIFYKLHMHKYPKEQNPLENSWGYANQQVPQKKRKGLSIWVWILIIYLILQVLFPILGLLFFSRMF